MAQNVVLVAAADGGAQAVIANDRMPDAVIGDFDSLTQSELGRFPADRLFPVREQESTDFDKALRNIDAPLVLGIGFLGGRVDHQLAVFNTLIRNAEKRCILIGKHEVIFHAPPSIRLKIEPGSIVSLFPLRQVMGRSRGLEWPIGGLVFEPDGKIGTSNRALSDLVLEFDGPGMLIMVPRDSLDQVMQAFQSELTGRWPARAE